MNSHSPHADNSCYLPITNAHGKDCWHRFTGLIFLILFLPVSANAQDCTPTEHRTTGTHYKPVTVHKTDISSGVTVAGRILEAVTCKPVRNARVAHWQADTNGIYVDHLRAYLYSNSKGEYQFKTEWPALSVPHIHFIVSAPGYQTIETQWRGDQETDEIFFDIILRKQ